MEMIVEDLDILLSPIDIFVSEIKDTASDMVELINIVGVVLENILQVKDIFKRQCTMIVANANNYKIDSLQIRALVKENSCKTDIPSCSSDEQMMDLIFEKEEKIRVKEVTVLNLFSLLMNQSVVAVEVPQTLEYRGGQLNAAPVLENFQDSPDDEENIRSSHGYLNDLEEEYQARALLAKSKDSSRKRILRVDQLTEDPSSSGLKDQVFLISSVDDTKVTIPGVERPWLSEAECFILPNHDIGRILPSESQRNTTDSSVAVTDSSATNYDSADESSVCSIHLSSLKKLDGAEPISKPKIIKSNLRSKSTFKAEALKDVTINKPSSTPAKGNKSSSALNVHLAPAGIYYLICKLCGSYDHDTNDHNKIISLERKIDLRNPQHAFKKYEACGSLNHTTTDYYDIEWFKKGEAL
nr:hypothetical protein CTI12_AA224790 [Tanacetum cinerariifolium]